MSLLKVNEVQNYNGSSLTLTASTVSTSAQLNTGGNISVTGSLNVSDDSTTRSNLGLGSIATQAADSVDIDGGTIDGTVIGGSTAVAGTFTTLNTSGNVTLGGNLVIPNGGTIGSVSDTDAITIDSSGDVGIGTSSPSGKLNLSDSTSSQLNINSSAAGFTRQILFSTGTNTQEGQISASNATGELRFESGRSGTSAYFQTFFTNNNERMRIDSSGHTRPGADNTYDLGISSYRWDDVYATNGTIQTSDINEKQDIEELSEAEKRVAIAAKGLLRKYRWKSAVAEKGDDARMHFGIIAQDLKAAFEAEGLDGGRYGMFIHSEWWEIEETYTDDDGVEKTRINTFDTEEEAPEGAVKKDRMGIRYCELLAFIIASI